ncbi:MAG: 16S rRNA (guanine(527)-N(7))-methyltransferase RsmG [Gammaproteobacteria bacterium]|jgi:16S rRNA (guanine527-N7)-methyltransferase
MQTNDLSSLLTQHLQTADITISPEKIKQLSQYIELLFQWNTVYNLTATKTPDAFITDHILDSLVIGPYLQGDNIIDVGSGAGLPGIPLSIYYPDKQFTLLESRSKRVRFLQMVVATLKLKNVNIVNQRAEQYHVERLFTTVVTRAFSSLKEMLQMTAHLCHASGLFLAMKGRYPTTEIAQIQNEFTVILEQALTVPGMNKERHIIGIKRKEH